MPSMTRDNVDALNAFVKAGRIEEARSLLEGIDGEKAANALKRLNDRYPPVPSKTKSPVGKGDPLVEAKRLIILKDYDGAEKLLWESDDPAAGELLRKLTLVKSAGVKPGIAAPVNVKEKPKRSTGSTIRRVVILLGIIALLVVLAVNQSNNYWRDYNAAMMDYAIYDICFDVYRDDYPNYSFEQMSAGCHDETDHLIRNYTATAERCYAAWKDEDHKLIECLVDGGAKFDGIWILSAG